MVSYFKTYIENLMSNKCKLFSVKFNLNYLQIYYTCMLGRCGVAGAFIPNLHFKAFISGANMRVESTTDKNSVCLPL